MLDQFSATIDSLYAAATDSRRWHEALREVEVLTGSAGAVIDLVPLRETVQAHTIAGSFGVSECATYARDYMPLCPRIRYALKHPSGTQYDYLFITEKEMDRDPVYDWFDSYGLRYHLGSWIAQTPSYRATFSLQRSRSQGHADDRDIRIFDLLKPHAARAISLADQLASLGSFERMGTAILDALPQSVFALGADGAVVLANSAAGSLLEAADGLSMSSGRLRTDIASEQAALDRLIVEASEVALVASSGWTRVSRRTGGPPYAVFVAPLRTGDDELAAAAARVLVVVHDPCARTTADPAMLAAVFALTETEARLASALSGGHSLESAAASLNMCVATARSHLKSVFAKLGVNRQQDLVRLLASLSTVKL